MKKMLFILMLAVVANAQIMLENVDCNNRGMPDKACHVSFSQFGFGQNFSPAGNLELFFFDAANFNVSKSSLPASANVPLSEDKPTLPIRFIVHSNEQGYKSAMSLIHTAYAARSMIDVIFMNPAVKLYESYTDFAKATGEDKTFCFVNRYAPRAGEKLGEPASIYCPVKAISLYNN